MTAAGILAAIGNTPLVELPRITPKPTVRILVRLEGTNPTGSLKDRVAKAMIEAAKRAGALSGGKIILEPTSGNTGIALAMVGRLKGRRVTVVVPENVTLERRQLLALFGAEVVYSEGRLGGNGAIRMAQGMARAPKYSMPCQYGNPANPQTPYDTTAAEILRDCPEIDALVAGHGAGGMLMGCARRLKERNPAIRVVAVGPHPGDLVQGLRSLDEGIHPFHPRPRAAGRQDDRRQPMGVRGGPRPYGQGGRFLGRRPPRGASDGVAHGARNDCLRSMRRWLEAPEPGRLVQGAAGNRRGRREPHPVVKSPGD